MESESAAHIDVLPDADLDFLSVIDPKTFLDSSGALLEHPNQDRPSSAAHAMDMFRPKTQGNSSAIPFSEAEVSESFNIDLASFS